MPLTFWNLDSKYTFQWIQLLHINHTFILIIKIDIQSTAYDKICLRRMHMTMDRKESSWL